MSDGERLLEAIKAEPADDLVRLAYADWCEETGDAERAAYIRQEVIDPDPEGEKGPLYARASWPDSLYRIFTSSRYAGLIDERTTPRWRRGFIAEVRCTMAEWLEHGPAVARAHPIERVEITYRRPAGPSDLPTDMKAGVARGWKWWGLAEDDPDGFSPMDLPSPIWMALEAAEVERRMKIYPEKQAAKDALSAACIRWARGQSIGMK